MDRTKPINMTREEAAARRVASALQDIEEAQNLLSRASAALGSLYGVHAQSSATQRLYAQVKRTWYALDERWRKSRAGRGKRVILDHEPNGYEDQWGPLPVTATSTDGKADA